MSWDVTRLLGHGQPITWRQLGEGGTRLRLLLNFRFASMVPYVGVWALAPLLLATFGVALRRRRQGLVETSSESDGDLGSGRGSR